MSTANIEIVLQQAQNLSKRDQMRLIALIAQEAASGHEELSSAPHDPWMRLAALREEFRALGPVLPSMGEQIELDRQSRADFLEGRSEERDVHA